MLLMLLLPLLIPSLRFLMRKGELPVSSLGILSTILLEERTTMLLNQGVSITQSELEKLKNISGVMFDLPINDQTYPSLAGLVVRPYTRGPKADISIFTHFVTSSKYVGSSYSLSFFFF